MQPHCSAVVNSLAVVPVGDTGEARKAAALHLHRRLRPHVIRAGQRALINHLLAGNPVATADDVHDAVAIPAGLSPTCLGAVPGALVAAGLIRRDGYRPARRPEAHCRPTAMWVIVDPDAAERWLAAHPVLPNLGATP